MESKETTGYFELLNQYHENMDGLVESVRKEDIGSAMDRVTMMLIVAQNILKLAVFDNQTNCLLDAKVLLQNTAQLSVALSNVWSCSTIDQGKAWNQIIPVMERMRKLPLYN